MMIDRRQQKMKRFLKNSEADPERQRARLCERYIRRARAR
jgi:hypothetical protein